MGHRLLCFADNNPEMAAWTQFMLQTPSRLDMLANKGTPVEELILEPDILTAILPPGTPLIN